MNYLLNAFSLNMLPKDVSALIKVKELRPDEWSEKVKSSEFVNAIGHKATAELVNEMTGLEIKPNRIDVKFKKGDVAFVIQVGFRLQEGQVLNKEEMLELYEEGKLRFFEVQL